MPRLLIVDDDEAVCASLTLLLKQKGYETLACTDAAQALAALTRKAFDLVRTLTAA